MKPRGEGSALNGYIDKGSYIRGDLSFEETFRIDGRFEGKIRSGGELILGDDADVNAEMEVGRLSVNGKLKGSVHATERVELLAGARVLGHFEGSCQMGKEASNLLELPYPRQPV
jgi:cytoskeletal protein CcmA (bactofilin family)